MYRRSSCATLVVCNPIRVLLLVVSTFPLYLHSMSVCSISLSPTQTKYAVFPESTMDLLTGTIKSSVGSDEKSNNNRNTTSFNFNEVQGGIWVIKGGLRH